MGWIVGPLDAIYEILRNTNKSIQVDFETDQRRGKASSIAWASEQQPSDSAF